MLDIYYSKNEDGKRVQNIVFEYCSTNLEEVIQKAKEARKPIPISEIRNYMKQILTGMAYVHS
jgi:serine/threonine protein kinase